MYRNFAAESKALEIGWPANGPARLPLSLQVYRDEDLLTGMYGVPLRYDPDLIRQVVQDLTPERARVMWASKTLEVVGIY